mmetsp:Transcript_34265/g.82870  ORF Transcript_34265/g.82870 Transcript_34265/m.82870 type:complete len:186 (+) Transcript_34265:124-681(+)
MFGSRFYQFSAMSLVAIAPLSASSAFATNYSKDETCADERLIRFETMSAISQCFRECSDLDTDDVRGYLGDDKCNATGSNESVELQELFSWADIALLSLLWYLVFSNFHLHQILVLVIFLLRFLLRKSWDTNATIGFFIAGFVHYFVAGKISDDFADNNYDEANYENAMGPFVSARSEEWKYHVW